MPKEIQDQDVPRMFLHKVGHELAIVVLLAISQSIHSQSYEHLSYSPDY
jgi:hypothetical protein